MTVTEGGTPMTRYTRIGGIVGLVAIGVVAWALFRPELLWVNARVNESGPESASSASATSSAPAAAVLATGSFHGVAHKSAGTAAIHQLADGRRVLRFTNFETSNGPDVHVYLVAADDAADSAAVTRAGFIEVGVLKGNIGDQNYELPASADLGRYRAVTIWCKRFSVNFATAPLMPTARMISSATNTQEGSRS
jgi:Electron transfer DM13